MTPEPKEPSLDESRAALMAIPDLIFQIKDDGTFLNYKGDREDLYVPPEQFIGKKVQDVLPEQLARQTLEYVGLALESKKLQVYEYSLQIGDHLKYFEARMIPYEKDKVIAVVRDITGRKRIEEVLVESEKSLRTAQRMAHIGSWWWTVGKDTVTWSEELYRINGRDPKLSAPSFAEMSACYTPESWKRLSEQVAKTLQNGEAYELELENVRPDGSTVITLSRGEADLDASGKIVGLHGTVLDINERKRAEEALLKITDKYDAILKADPDILMEVDHNKVYTWANKAGYEFFGSEVIGKEADYYFMGPQTTYQNVESLFEGNEEVVYLESWQKRKDGEPRLLAWWCRVLKDHSGKVLGALSSARDITEQKKMELTLREKINQLKLINDVAIGRENKMIELEKEIDELRRQLGMEPKYK